MSDSQITAVAPVIAQHSTNVKQAQFTYLPLEVGAEPRRNGQCDEHEMYLCRKFRGVDVDDIPVVVLWHFTDAGNTMTFETSARVTMTLLEEDIAAGTWIKLTAAEINEASRRIVEDLESEMNLPKLLRSRQSPVAINY